MDADPQPPLSMRMKAVVYTEYGPPDVLRLEERERPEPGDDEIRIRVRAVEATKSDCEMRCCRFAVRWLWLPMRVALGIRRPRREVLGAYFSGEVESVGKDVERFSVGDAVYGAARLHLGAYAGYVCLPADYTIEPKPRNMSFEEAAAVPLGGLNALHFMRKAGVRKGERVLINGAGGSIGAHAVQIAKHLGAEVTAVDSAIKEPMLRRIGADHFIDYTREHFSSRGECYDIIFSTVASTSYSACIRSLKPGGRYLMANPRISDMIRSVVTSRFTDKSALFAFAAETREELNTLREMIESGAIVSIVDEVFPLQRAADAHRKVEAEERLGAVVIAVS